MNSALARILLRYCAAFIIAKGWFSPAEIGWLSDDPDAAMAVEAFIGFAIMGATEAWYYVAKRSGWAT